MAAYPCLIGSITLEHNLSHQTSLEPPSLGGVFGLAVFLASFVVVLVAVLWIFFSAEDPEITYSCSPEQPHRSVKECVR